MTTLKELGLMLIEVADNGRVMQMNYIHKPKVDWIEVNLMTLDLEDFEYRLKPKVTYYRAFTDYDGEGRLCYSEEPFMDWDGWKGAKQEFVKDFEVES